MHDQATVPPTPQQTAGRQYDQVMHNTSYHRPKHGETMVRMDGLREAAKAFVAAVHQETQDIDMPRERAMAYTDIESALQHAIGGLARHEPDVPFSGITGS